MFESRVHHGHNTDCRKKYLLLLYQHRAVEQPEENDLLRCLLLGQEAQRGLPDSDRKISSIPFCYSPILNFNVVFKSELHSTCLKGPWGKAWPIVRITIA